jgi:beta-glucanase (GH16 family)
MLHRGVRALVLGMLAVLMMAGLGQASPRPDAGPGAAAARTSEPTCGGVRPLKQTGGRYRCTFTDDFNGSALDTSKWIVQETAWSGMSAASSGCYVNSPDNISVSGGAAHLTARQEPAPFVCKNPYGDYVSQSTVATIATARRFTQAFGRFEFRARFPATTVQGLHSALWLYPAQHTYGRWPNSGEIDVAEWWSARSGYVIPSVHYQGEPAPWSSGLCTMTDPWQWHRYAVEWTQTSVRFLYDDKVCFEHSWTPDAPLVAPQPFDQPFYLVLTQAFGADWNAVTPETPSTGTLQVDWVRAWR